MEFESYGSFWNHQAATPEGALAGVDGSASEETVRMTGRWAARQVSRALGLDGSQRVLELGCGVGRIGRELVDNCRAWHGVDISQSMLSVAAERLAGAESAEFSLLKQTSLDMIADESLDAAYSVAVLCHIDKEDLYLYLEELNRCVADGGLIYVETWNLAHPMGWRRWDFEVNAWRDADQQKRKNVSRNQFCVPEEFHLYLEKAGWEIVRSWSDSPWIQVVAGKGLDEDRLAAERSRLDACADGVVYSARFSELFGRLLDVIYGLAQPQALFDDLTGDDPETRMFRAYLVALWRQGEAHWGPPPESD